MEHAIRLDSERLVAVLEATLQDLELLATLPERESLDVDTDSKLKPAVRHALRRQFDIESALFESGDRQEPHEERPETLEDDSSQPQDKDEGEEDHALLHGDGQTAMTGAAAARAFPRSLHRLLQQLREDRAARDVLRQHTATSVSPSLSRLAYVWTQLIINMEVALGTSSEQDERSALSLRESTMRLREAEDDRKQVGFELAQAREARAEMTRKFTALRAGLEVQLRDTKRAADDVLGPTARDREQDQQAALSGFETQNSIAQEQLAAVRRTVERVTQSSQQVEADERKHTQHSAAELRELLERYDADMDRLDADIVAEERELRRLAAASAQFESHFRRIDDDRRLQLDEQRELDLAERLRRSRDGTLFLFVRKLQAVVRGFLTRRRLRLERQSKERKKKRRAKTRGKKARKKSVGSGSKTKTNAKSKSGKKSGKKLPIKAKAVQ